MAAVTVNSVAVTGTGFSVSPVSLPATLNPGQTLSVTLTFNPAAVGTASGQLTISSNSSTNSTVTLALSGTGESHQVDLNWVAPSGSSVPITAYNVYRSQSGTGSFALMSSVSSQTAYTDMTVQSGKNYDYVVKSVDSSGVESTPSNTTTVAIP
jgi:predicted phage tail protein